MKRCIGIVIVFWVLVLSNIGQTALIPDLYIDVGQDYNNDGDTQTARFDTFLFQDNTKSVYPVDSRADITIGTTFDDYGHAIIQNLKDTIELFPGDPFNVYVEDENMRNGQNDTGDWEITLYWEDLTGQVVEITSNNQGDLVATGKYNPGATFYMYIDTTPDFSFGSSAYPDDDSGYNDGDILIKGTLLEGHGTVTIFPYGSQQISRTGTFLIEVTEVSASTPYIGSDTYDLSDLVGKHWLLAIAGESAASQNLVWGGENDNDNIVYVGGDGGGSFQMYAVPEPASILLLGGGLFIIGMIGRKKLTK